MYMLGLSSLFGDAVLTGTSDRHQGTSPLVAVRHVYLETLYWFRSCLQRHVINLTSHDLTYETWVTIIIHITYYMISYLSPTVNVQYLKQAT